MRGLTRPVIGAALALCVLGAVSSPRRAYPAQQQPSDLRALTKQERAIKVSITTGGGLFGPPQRSYRVGQRVPVSITMTNTSDDPLQVCVSGTLYQDRPKLFRDGQPVPYLNWQWQMARADQKDETCVKLGLPEPIILRPKEGRVVDWFILAEGNNTMADLAWYEPLPAGKYELSIERRLDCCDGPMVESNKISFEVVP